MTSHNARHDVKGRRMLRFRRGRTTVAHAFRIAEAPLRKTAEGMSYTRTFPTSEKALARVSMSPL